MPGFNLGNAINIVLTGVLAMVGSVVAGVVAAIVTHRLTRKRDHEDWSRELVLVEERWKKEVQLLQTQWKHQHEEKEHDRLLAELLRGVDSPQETISRARWRHFSDESDGTAIHGSAQRSQMVGQASLVATLIELLRTSQAESLSADKREVISQGLELLNSIHLGQVYLAEDGRAPVLRPESAFVAAHLTARGKMDLLETAYEVLESLLSQESEAWPNVQRVDLAVELLAEVRKGLLAELESAQP